MIGNCGPSFLQFGIWLGDLVRSLFPWPAVVLFALLFPPVRRMFVAAAESVQGLRGFKVAGIEFTLDPGNARELRAKSTAVVLGDYERKANELVARYKIWPHFQRVVEKVIKPAAHGGFRATLHIQDILDQQSLYQLVDYIHAGEQQGPVGTHGRRNSIRFGIIGRAWRLGRSDYDPQVSTDTDQLIEKWGMTRDEAARAGRGRQSFAVILLHDSTGSCPGLIFIDGLQANLLGDSSVIELERRVTAAAQDLCNGVARIRSELAQEFRAPAQQ